MELAVHAFGKLGKAIRIENHCNALHDGGRELQAHCPP